MKRGIGFAPSESWKHAISNAVTKHGLKTLPVLDSVSNSPQAQVLHMVTDPFADKYHNWSMVRRFEFCYQLSFILKFSFLAVTGMDSRMRMLDVVPFHFDRIWLLRWMGRRRLPCL